VIAGPVATRTLALLGADVLRIDRPDLPELIAQHLDTGMGKLSALLDLRKPADLEVLENLLSTADVVVTGYRPGALDRFGLDAEALLRRRPSLVVASLLRLGSDRALGRAAGLRQPGASRLRDRVHRGGAGRDARSHAGPGAGSRHRLPSGRRSAPCTGLPRD
jgi:crotonobetainyl-CoA:carnitine CoA-transferase CaiB-like acyl-CoA transferase